MGPKAFRYKGVNRIVFSLKGCVDPVRIYVTCEQYCSLGLSLNYQIINMLVHASCSLLVVNRVVLCRGAPKLFWGD